MRRRLLIAAVLAGGLPAGVAAANGLVLGAGAGSVRSVQDVPRADAAVVLGALVHEDGTLSAMLEDRVAAAARLYRAGRVPKVLLSGDHGRRGYDEVGAMRRRAIELGVPARDVFTDHAGFDTWDSVVRARKVFGVQRAVVVTQAFHLPRALFLAGRAGLDASGYVADRRSYGAESGRVARREVLARVKAVGDVFGAPRFLGPLIPITGDGRESWGPEPAAATAAQDESPPPSLPEADARLPRTAGAIAVQLADVSGRLHEAVDAWRRDGDPRTERAPRELGLLALRQQRLLLHLVRRRVMASRVLPLLPAELRRDARDVLDAKRALAQLLPPGGVPRSKLRTSRPLPPDALRRFYDRGTKRFGVGWELLAAVNFVETAFGRVRNTSWAGAQGPMQFMPATWRAYGLGGRIRDPKDSILGAANYLHANGAPRDEARALHHYNPDSRYVRAVRAFARIIRRDVRSFYVLYSWQVFFKTPDGTVRVTDP